MELAQQRISHHLVNSPKHPHITKVSEAAPVIDQVGIIEEYRGEGGDDEGKFVGYVVTNMATSQPPAASEIRTIVHDLRGCPLP